MQRRSRVCVPLITLVVFALICTVPFSWRSGVPERVSWKGCVGNGQSSESTASDAIDRSWLWSTATWNCQLGYFSSITASNWQLTTRTVVVDSPLGGSWPQETLRLPVTDFLKFWSLFVSALFLPNNISPYGYELSVYTVRVDDYTFTALEEVTPR